MDGGRAIPSGESERPTRIIPPLPAAPNAATRTAPRAPLKERFAKMFSTSGGSDITNNAISDALEGGTVSNGVSTNGGAPVNGTAHYGAVSASGGGSANGVVSHVTTTPRTRTTAPVLPPPPPVSRKQVKVKSGLSAQLPDPMSSDEAWAATDEAAMAADIPVDVEPTEVPAPTMSTPPRRQPRRARLRLTRIDPWSVMKTAFLLSVAFGIVTVSSVLIVWSVLGAAGVWDSVNESVRGVVGDNGGSTFKIENYIGTSRVLGFTALVAVIDVVLLTAIATLSAFLYNMAAALLGGLEVTLAEDS
ncbi:MAG: DUF3566 domain-containing protein [Nocardioides sp.]